MRDDDKIIALYFVGIAASFVLGVCIGILMWGV